MPQPEQDPVPVEGTPTRPPSWRRFVPGALLILAGLLIYAPALHGAWLRDDEFIIRDNPLMADPAGVWKFWFAPPGPDYFPLTSSLEWSLWRIFGNHTLPFHLTSLALHLLSAFLLWRLFARLGVRLAWLGAFLFLVHPLAVESVAWISELKNTLSLPLLLFSLLCWLNYDERRRPADYSAALFFFLAALLAKTSVVMLPFILLLHAWWKHGRVSREKWISIVPFFAVAAVLGVLTVFFQNQWAIGAEPIDAGGLPERTAGAGWAVLFYLGKFFRPVHLLPIYPLWSFTPLTPLLFAPWLGVLLTLGLLLQSRRTAWGRAAALGLGFFLLNLAPVLGFLTMSYMRISWVADHFTYLPMIGLIGLAAAGADKILAALPRFLLPIAAGLLVLLTFSLAWESTVDAAHYRSHEALWTYTLEQSPDSWSAELDLGLALTEEERRPEAVTHLEKSLQLHPDYYGTHLALANVLAQMNRLDEAAHHYTIAAHLRPETLEIHINYGDVLLRQGDVTGAERQYAQAVWFHPESAGAHYNYANILLREGRTLDAAAQYQLVLQIQPDLAAAREVLDKLHAAAASTTPAK